MQQISVVGQLSALVHLSEATVVLPPMATGHTLAHDHEKEPLLSVTQQADGTAHGASPQWR
jgi:hypothetical protein